MESPARRTAPPSRFSAYLEPDVLTSFEYSQTFRRRDHTPEMKLMFAVLINAIECLQRYTSAKTRRCRKLFGEAERWIFGGNGHALYSFDSVCEALELDANYLRKGLMCWRDQTGARSGPQRRVREPLRYSTRLRSTRITI